MLSINNQNRNFLRTDYIKQFMRGRNKPINQIKIAKERINILFKEADKAAKNKKIEMANRYINIARKIGMRYNVRISTELRRKFCRKCKKFLYPNLSSNEKEEKGFLIIVCKNCDKKMHYKLKEYKM